MDDKKFLIEDDDLEKLRPAFVKATKAIMFAIAERNPIWIRHHADADGYAGGVALQNAIIPIIIKEQYDKSAGYKRCKRSPSKTPYYHEEDATKDIIFHLEDKERWGSREPLLIVVDNGSTEEDIKALQKVKAVGFKVIVVDHHDPGDNKADQYIDAHINPHHIDGKSDLTAGMLGVELAHWINKDFYVPHIAAMSGIADRSRGEAYQKYLKLAAEEGFDEGYLEKMAIAIDYEAYLIRFQEGRQYFNLLLGEKNHQQEKLVCYLSDTAHEKKEVQFQCAKGLAKIEDKGKFILAKIPADGMTNRDVYPTIGKIAGMVRDWLEKEKGKQVVSLSIGNGKVSFRISQESPFDVNKIKASLQEKLPEANVTGGGHAHAGTLRFHSIAQDEVMKAMDNIFSG